MEWYLPIIWAGVIGIAVAMYVILDGFDLGLGILFPFAANDREREQMMASVKPFWDGNETWLVLGGGGLLVAFPLAYSIIMPAFYIPIIVMLLALVFRGITFEFRGTGGRQREMEFRFLRRLDARRLVPGRRPRRHDPGRENRERRFRRGRFRLGDALRSRLRARRRYRLRASRRHLDDHEDRRRDSGACEAAGAIPAARCAGLHGRSSACGRRC